MYDSDSKGISYTAGFFMLILFTLAAQFLAVFISAPVWERMTGRSVLEMKTYMTDPANANAMRVIQTISAVVGFLVPTFITALLLNRKPVKLLGFIERIRARQVLLVLGIIITGMLVSGLLGYLNHLIPVSSSLRLRFDEMEKEFMKQMKSLVALDNTSQYLLSLFILAFLPALCEETIFRGGLQNFLTRGTRKPWMSIIIVSLIFSIVHFSYYGFLSRFFLGVLLGLLFHYSGSIWFSILAHFVNNAVVVTILYVDRVQGKTMEDTMGDAGGGSGMFWGVLAIPALIYLLMLFKKAGPQPVAEPVDPKREELRDTPFY